MVQPFRPLGHRGLDQVGTQHVIAVTSQNAVFKFYEATETLPQAYCSRVSFLFFLCDYGVSFLFFMVFSFLFFMVSRFYGVTFYGVSFLWCFIFMVPRGLHVKGGGQNFKSFFFKNKNEKDIARHCRD